MRKSLKNAMVLLAKHDVLTPEVAEKMIRLNANDDEGIWRTTETGKHYHINGAGEVDKGPKAMVGGNVNNPSTWEKVPSAGGGKGKSEWATFTSNKGKQTSRKHGLSTPQFSEKYTDGRIKLGESSKRKINLSGGQTIEIDPKAIKGIQEFIEHPNRAEQSSYFIKPKINLDPETLAEIKRNLLEKPIKTYEKGFKEPQVFEIGKNNKATTETPNFNYADIFEKQTGKSWEKEASAWTSQMEARKNKKMLQTSNMEMADTCFERAKEWPEGSDERKIYDRYAESLSHSQPKRPTEEESKTMTQEYMKNISKSLKPYAIARYKKDLENEPQITKDICDIADELGTEMFGLDYRLKKASDNDKGVCRIDEKIRQDMKDATDNHEELTYEQAVDNLGDLVRYTQACTPENLQKNASKTLKALEAKGYKIVKVKNTWETFNQKNPYRGVNCSVVSPTGTKFELQFHTAESLVCKEVQHGWYEEARTESTSEERKNELNKRMYENATSMKKPENIGKLKSYKKE